MTKINVGIDVGSLVLCTSNDGGYLGGRCLICDEGGWSNGPDGYFDLGVAHGAKLTNDLTNQLIHKADCPVGDYIKAQTAA